MARAYKSRAQKKFADDGVDFSINMDGVISAIAAGVSLTENMKSDKYLDDVIDTAFIAADEQFNIAAVAMGEAGTIKHMFEWGTVGINKGRTNIKPNPLSETARLWHTFTQGRGLDRMIWFAYRPSIATVPKPTARDTGMSQTAINALSDHVFKWKAEVMEEGQQVMVSRKKAKWLLIPAYEDNRPYFRPSDIKRGYMLTKGPTHPNPGEQKFYGNFTKFWMGYWLDEGANMVNRLTETMIINDYEPEIEFPKRTSKTLRPVGTMNVRTEIAKKVKRVNATTKKKAAARRAVARAKAKK